MYTGYAVCVVLICRLCVLSVVSLLGRVCSLAIRFSFFFFQAEDGIRDLVRSRGLGDVYKRQGQGSLEKAQHQEKGEAREEQKLKLKDDVGRRIGPVSYTHLTLPTSDLV